MWVPDTPSLNALTIVWLPRVVRQIRSCERQVLDRLNYSLTVPTSYQFARRYLEVAEADETCSNLTTVSTPPQCPHTHCVCLDAAPHGTPCTARAEDSAPIAALIAARHGVDLLPKEPEASAHAVAASFRSKVCVWVAAPLRRPPVTREPASVLFCWTGLAALSLGPLAYWPPR